MSQTATRIPETIISMNESFRGRKDLTWNRLWIGIGCVIASILLVTAIWGTHVGAEYGLVILIITLVVALADGTVLSRRRRPR